MGGGCGVAFVEEFGSGCGVEVLGEVGAEGNGEGFGFGGLRAGFAACMDGEAYEHCRHVVAADEAGDGFEVGLQSCAVDGEEGLRGVAERVGQGDADAAVANVESEDAREGHGG